MIAKEGHILAVTVPDIVIHHCRNTQASEHKLPSLKTNTADP